MKQDHIIQKVFIEITVNNKEKGLSIKDDINSFLSMDVFPKIEKYLSTFEHRLEDHILQIPKLELNLDVKSSTLNSDLKNNIVQIFEEKLSEVTNPVLNSDEFTANNSEAYLMNNQEKILQSFIYFLERGSMPWWNSDKKSLSLLEPKVFNAIIQADHFQSSIISVFSKRNVQERIIHQLSDEQIAQLCNVILKDKALKINLESEIIQLISKLDQTNRIMVWRLILNILSRHLKSPTIHIEDYFLEEILKSETLSKDLFFVKNHFHNLKTVLKIFPIIKEAELIEKIENTFIKSDQNTKKTTKKNEQNFTETNDLVMQNSNNSEQKDEEIASDEGQYVQNAGLVLIHPFMKTFFEHCDLLDKKTNQLSDPELGAHLLHYIATGRINAPEYDMIFEKFLCNIPLHQPINRHIKLTRKHKTQVKNLIESVQHNWSAMKTSSAELLQNEFFQRPGKLVFSNHDCTLTVERKTQDILLERLSWGIGLVKLPWKDQFMFVNW
ncbi:hypothetical protein H9Q08_03415 [Chryseobacterium sp. PS-8]|uniref:Uncharacterized protein n=1 Tax=Chryseobacterium indicum TaxID=2766954 RepID=A0ABS9C1A8_9FLAO|nr:contractile injection system tape measure protein [Chryseobacterium sp. PS-8]MCF2218343.1 hypothetical protein [Chryseobacterium sp. PS-8]